MKCSCCGESLQDGVCLNIDCEKAREQATRGAARETRKAAAGETAMGARSFSSSGRVD